MRSCMYVVLGMGGVMTKTGIIGAFSREEGPGLGIRKYGTLPNGAVRAPLKGGRNEREIEGGCWREEEKVEKGRKKEGRKRKGEIKPKVRKEDGREGGRERAGRVGGKGRGRGR